LGLPPKPEARGVAGELSFGAKTLMELLPMLLLTARSRAFGMRWTASMV
jgi:hypothetical protein